jgi:hypothetical protein
MTTIVTIQAHCAVDEQVVVRVTDATDVPVVTELHTLRTGETVTVNVYGTQVVQVAEYQIPHRRTMPMENVGDDAALRLGEPRLDSAGS